MERYLCIHCHFYQPPRENPWLEAIELQESAYPYHDWNERITAECYAPNTASRILDGEGRIAQIINNYARISFNVGPTLLDWLAVRQPEVYHAIVAADHESQKRFGGHGSALAQAYNHMIMPLANHRDRCTQVLWGVRDFEQRFGRRPEGMWLPETAVDLESLDILAEHGILFTILTPYQARRVRRIGTSHWHDVGSGGIDPTMAYRARLPSGRTIALFFYDGPISRAVAFEGLLSSGERFAERLLGGFHDGRTWPQLMHIATDGETYGHHHRHGDMALAYALDYIERNRLARLTNYGEYLEHHPPTHEVEIHENTSWSCAHGVDRWRDNCGCHSGLSPGWNQLWRGPLRRALEWLRDVLAPEYAALAGQYLADPWAARDDYVAVVLDRSPENVDRFLARHAGRELDATEQVTVLKLLELQRHAMLMFTSCGWFFDELSGIEPVQLLQYAGRAIQLAHELFGDTLEPRFLALLERAPSNMPEHGNGRQVYERFVKPAMVDLKKVGAHYAMSTLFEMYPQRARVYGYAAELEDYQRRDAGIARLAVGRARVTSVVTRESADLSFSVLHFGDHNLNGGVRDFPGEEAARAMVQEITTAFERADFPAVIRAQDRHFGASSYSLRSLFRDEQRKILRPILDETLGEAEAVYRQVYERHAPLMRYLADLDVRQPRALRTAADYVLNVDLRQAFADEAADPAHVRALLREADTWRVELDTVGLGYTLRQTIEHLAESFHTHPGELALLQRLETEVSLARSLPFEVDLWKAQNLYYDMLKTAYPFFQHSMERDPGDEGASAWLQHFRALGDQLRVRLD